MAGVERTVMGDMAVIEEGGPSALHDEMLGVGVACAIKLSEQDELEIGVDVLVQPQTGVELVVTASTDNEDSDEQLCDT